MGDDRPSDESALCGARAIARTAHWANHIERAREVWRCMRDCTRGSDPRGALGSPNACVLELEDRARSAELRVRELSETYTDEKETVWTPPTAYAYAKACRALEHHRAESERLSRRLELIEGRKFPIMGGGPNIPWVIIAPYESQAQSNHGQSLERLAQRGGLDIGEAVAIMTGRAWREIRRDLTIDEFNAFVAKRMRAYGAQS